MRIGLKRRGLLGVASAAVIVCVMGATSITGGANTDAQTEGLTAATRHSTAMTGPAQSGNPFYRVALRLDAHSVADPGDQSFQVSGLELRLDRPAMALPLRGAMVRVQLDGETDSRDVSGDFTLNDRTGTLRLRKASSAWLARYVADHQLVMTVSALDANGTMLSTRLSLSPP